MLAAAVLAGCAAQPSTIAADDEMLCRSSEAGGGQPYSQCRGKLNRLHARVVAESASRIEGVALLRAPAPGTDTAGRCRAPEPGKDCSAPDVTGTIPETPRRDR